MLIVALVTGGVIAWISGFLFGFWFHKQLWWISLLINGFALIAFLVLRWWGYRQMNELDKQRKAMRRGEAGEIAVASKLQDFPDNFFVIHDLGTPSGNVDHVAIGPTGVFAIDAKGWKGVVSADGRGELLLNNEPTAKPFVKQFVGRVMGIKDRLKALAPGMEPYIQAVYVFTSARVEAKWGATGAVHCVRDEQLYDYIVEDKKRRKLNPAEVKTIARAFAALARMDPDFAERSTPKTRQAPKESAQRTA